MFEERLMEALSLIKQHREELQLTNLYLFGSYARGEHCRTSDIDLLLLTDGNSKEVSYLVTLYDIRDDIGYPEVDVVVRNKDKFNPIDDDVFYKYVVNDLREVTSYVL